MFLHDRDQYITRQGQIFPVKSAHDGGGHFDEICYFVEQTFVNNSFTTDKSRGLSHLLDDGGFAFFFIETQFLLRGSRQSIYPQRGF